MIRVPLRPTVEADESGEFDLIAALASPLPAIAIAFAWALTAGFAKPTDATHGARGEGSATVG